MELTVSKVLHGRKFWVDETRTEPHEGLPCFSFNEIALLKALKSQNELTTKLLGAIFDAKQNLGCQLDNVLINGIKQRVGIEKKHFTERQEMTRSWAARIRQDIEKIQVCDKNATAEQLELFRQRRLGVHRERRASPQVSGTRKGNRAINGSGFRHADKRTDD